MNATDVMKANPERFNPHVTLHHQICTGEAGTFGAEQHKYSHGTEFYPVEIMEDLSVKDINADAWGSNREALMIAKLAARSKEALQVLRDGGSDAEVRKAARAK